MVKVENLSSFIGDLHRDFSFLFNDNQVKLNIEVKTNQYSFDLFLHNYHKHCLSLSPCIITPLEELGNPKSCILQFPTGATITILKDERWI